MNFKKIFTGVTRNIILLGWVSLFTDISSQMVFPLIPLYLTSVLGAGATAVGIVEGAAESSSSLLKVVSGYWSDKMRVRKPFVLSGYTISTFMKPLLALATSWFFVLFVRVFERIGKGLRTAPRDAIIAESVQKDTRGKAYGLHRTMDGMGSVMGAVLAFFLLPILGYRNIFLLAFIPGIIAVLLIIWVKENKRSNGDLKKKMRLDVSFKELPGNLKLFILASSVFAFGHFGYAFLLLKSKNIGLDDSHTIFLYALLYITYTVTSTPLGILSDQIGRKPLLIGSYAVFAFISLGLVFASDSSGILFYFILYGIFFAAIDGSQRAFVVDLVPAHIKGTALGTFHTAVGLMALPGSFIAGLLWDKIDPTATFVYSMVLSLMAIILIGFVKIRPTIEKM